MARSHTMKTHTKIVLGAGLAIAILGAAAVTASAGYRGHGPHGGGFGETLFEKFDANSDGKITKDEIAAVRKDRFAKYDANKDGTLSLEEYKGLFAEMMQQRMVRSFQKLDRDGDGKVTDAEMARKLDRLMAHLDRDDNGEIEKSDLRRPKGDHPHGDRR